MSCQKDCRLYYHNSFISLWNHSFRPRSLTLLLTWCSSWEASLCFTLNDRRHQLCTFHSNRGYHNCLVFSIIFLSLPPHQQTLIFPTIIYFWLQSINKFIQWWNNEPFCLCQFFRGFKPISFIALWSWVEIKFPSFFLRHLWYVLETIWTKNCRRRPLWEILWAYISSSEFGLTPFSPHCALK